MPFRRNRVKPTAYPAVSFHILRSAQLLASTVVFSILFYFLSSLSSSHHSLPWTFILLLATALLTVVSLTCTIVLHIFYGLNSVLNTILNSILALLWAVSFALLSWWSSGTLSHVCNQDNWDNDMGIAVCRMYKALFSFGLLGLVATMVALGLDVHVQRQAGVRGRFQAIGMVRGHNGKSVRTDEHERNPDSSATRSQGNSRGGYALPEEQFVYGDNTGYHGAGGQVGRKSLEERT